MIARRFVGITALLLTAFQLWQTLTSAWDGPTFLAVHLGWILWLIFMTKPAIRHRKRTTLTWFVDAILAIVAIVASIRVAMFDYSSIDFLLYGLAGPDLAAGVALLVLLLEAGRRTIGPVLSFIALSFLLYTLFGDLLPQNFASKGFSFGEITRFQIFSTNGVYGSALGISASMVFGFVLFGALLHVSGGAPFFIDLAVRAAGSHRGGPAKAAVLSSAGMGSISGSAIANVLATGTLTIPLMKKLGYRPDQSAGVEAAASTGGQIMPPVMGAGAFIMSEFTGLPYSTILLASMVPAILYFVSVLLFVHLIACRSGLKGLPRSKGTAGFWRQGWRHLLPLVTITVLLLAGFSPAWVAVAGCALVVVADLLCGRNRTKWRRWLAGLTEAGLLIPPISAACALAGIVVGAIGQTGLGLHFTNNLVTLGGNSLLLTFLLVSLAALILGMGLPVTAAYIVLSVIAVPLLLPFGINLLTAHLVVFWLSQSSNITPPVALAAFAAAGVADCSPMKAALQAVKLGGGILLIPMMMLYSALVWQQGPLWPTLLATGVTLLLLLALAVALEGFLLERLAWWLRAALLGLSVLLVSPRTRLLAAVLMVMMLTATWLRQRSHQSRAAAAPVGR